MSDNYREYPAKMAAQRLRRMHKGPLWSQVEELYALVRECEARWMLEELDKDLRDAG